MGVVGTSEISDGINLDIKFSKVSGVNIVAPSTGTSLIIIS